MSTTIKRAISPKMRMVRRILRGFAVLVALGVLGVGALLVSLWLERWSEMTLPPPTGPFAVGRAIYDWVDDAGSDTLAPVAGTKRELLLWIWYPAATGAPGAVVDDYLPAQLRAPARPAAGSLISGVLSRVFGLLTRDLSKVHGHSVREPDVSSQQRSYPVVIMRAGASAPVMNYSTLAEDLASHGYVVVGFDAPYRTGLVVFPDGRVIARRPENNPELFSGAELTRLADKLLTAWTADTGFVLDQLERLNASDASGKFKGRLDMARVGAFGHSLGGATAAQFCSQDSRCKAGIDVDGSLHGSVIQAGISKPFMFLLSDHGDFSSDAETRQIQADIQSVYGRLPEDGRVQIAIRGANHFTFSDDGALLKSHVVRGYSVCSASLVSTDVASLLLRRTACTAFSTRTLRGKAFRGSRFHRRFTQRSNFSTETPHGCIRSQTLAPSGGILGRCVPCRRHHIRRPRWLGCVQSDANHMAAGRLADQRRRIRGSYLARALSTG